MAEHSKTQVADDGDKSDKKALKIGLAIGCIVVALAVMIYTYQPPRKFRVDERFYSVDDGKTWYTDSINNIPPYQHNGKTAYAAQIYSYAGGSKQFCGYLIRFPERVKSQIEKNASAAHPAGAAAWGTETRLQMEVKAPSNAGPWVGFTSAAAAPIIAVRAPDGSELDEVLP